MLLLLLLLIGNCDALQIDVVIADGRYRLVAARPLHLQIRTGLRLLRA